MLTSARMLSSNMQKASELSESPASVDSDHMTFNMMTKMSFTNAIEN